MTEDLSLIQSLRWALQGNRSEIQAKTTTCYKCHGCSQDNVSRKG